MAPDKDPTPAELLQRAYEAAQKGNAVGMLTNLKLSGILDGVHRKLADKYWRFSPEDVDIVIGRTIDDFLTAARTGKKVLRPAAWFFKVASNHAYDYDLKCGSERPTDPATMSRLVEDSGLDQDDGALREARLSRAVGLARDLLPHLGEQNVQRVMAFLLDAIAAGDPDVPALAIAEALGMHPESVRSWMSRGFARLEREARKRGIVLDPEVSEASRLSAQLDEE